MIPTVTARADRAQELLEALAGPDARLRPEQLAAIEVTAGDRGRALVVQRTGFGKSAIYFIATKLRREDGAGPTLVVSPLLALMRDQVAAAERLGVRSATINSTNLDDWSAIEAAVAAGEIDLLCISPERLNNPGFANRVLPRLAAGLGLLVIDEAHCISDWGHDFRPDYRRIRDAIANLSPETPVLATTATANERVCADVAEQMGAGVAVMRGRLDRESLHLGVVALPTHAHRLAWLAQRIPDVEGTGIVYCLTVAQTELVAAFLRAEGIDAVAYSSGTDAEDRLRLEASFKENRVKVLVATSALGMGVDKPDVTFVHHLGAPPSPIAYYQQVGRAGRSVPRAEAWLLPGEEDRAIWSWFASVGMPPEPLARRVLDTIGESGGEPASVADLERRVDLRRGRLETLLKILDVDGAVAREGRGWVLTGHDWHYDTERVDRVSAARRQEAQAMLTYAEGASCLMGFLRTSLDDPEVDAAPCGRCAVCTGTGDPVELDPAVVRRAVELLRGVDVPLEPRKQWARGLPEPRGNIGPAARAEEGRALTRVDDAGWWPVVARALASGAPDDELIDAMAAVLKRWPWEARPTWITWIPSTRHEALLAATAERLGALGKLPVHPAVGRREGRPPQADQQNSAHKLVNVWGAFVIDGAGLPEPAVRSGPVLLLDDLRDSGWTMTVVAAALRDAGTGPVLPFALARR
ncbi:RecQ family ATP-dependent DNA helicase [Iamia sp.]|uniref:RecQ family ATP-dependent DNA helicase n=1 Tax=Iamia sp. TaxID=2722710 RepID=UPI002BF01795|nr:RecQ family ATP-dependent DNA helicase [Iamia sp.]HXH59157.1 RecQ family ATP-dependent DNA helicase [Iamia sp.]